MEENKKIQVNNKILYTDTSPEFQPEGTSRYRLNAIPETELGEQGNFSNELGNVSKIVLPNQNIIIGHIPILDDKTIIFSVRADNTNSEIGLYNEKTNSYSTLIKANCLDFKITNQVRGEFKVREGCNINIYFTDNINPWRTIDIDNREQYLIDQSNTPVQTRINAANSTGLGWDCNSFKLFRDYNQTNVNMQVFNTGGNTKVGMYQFTYQYLDDDFNPQPWNTPANPIPIVKDSLNDYITLDGDETNTDTNKSIQITISNIDTRYKFVRIGLIVSVLGTGFNSNAYILEEVPVENNSITYLFAGLDPNKTQSTDLEAFQYLPPDYYTGKDLKQIDNSLVLAYPKARDVDYVPFIQAALQIKSRYHIKDLFAEGTGENSFGNRYPNSYFYNKSLMRDEVYSFGIVYIFKDGTETPAFHIPGRAKDFDSTGTFIDSQKYERRILIPSITPNPNFNLHNRAKTTEYGGNGSTWDSVEYNANLEEIKSNIIDERQISNNKIERWKIFNTAIRTEYLPQQDNPGYFISKGELAYWESQDYTYPSTTDCNTNLPIYGDLVGQKVRYHKMPDATLEPHYYGYSNLTNPTTQKFAAIRPLNIEFFNVNIPSQYIDQIQGYRIVRVERNTFNSSVVDKGLMYQNEPYSKNGQSNELGVTQNFPFNRRLNALQNTLPTTIDIDENYYRWFKLNDQVEYFANITKGTRHKSIHTPLSKVDKDSVMGDYIKFERTLFGLPIENITVYNTGKRNNNDRVYYDEISDTYYRLGQNDTWHGEVGVRYNNSDIPKSLSNVAWQKNITNRKINRQGYIESGFNKTGVFDYPFYNKTQNETFAVELGGLDNTYGDVSTGGDFSNTYTSIGLGFLEAGPSASVFIDGELARELNWELIQVEGFRDKIHETSFYVSIKKYLPNQYNGISQQVYVAPSNISTNNTLLYSNGDCFINDWAFKKYADYSDDGNSVGYRFLNTFKNVPNGNSDFITLRSLNRFWCESPINMELRHPKEDVVNSHYGNIGNDDDMLHKTAWYAPKNYNDGNNMRDFLLPEVAWNEGRFGTVRNYYGYNKDFGIENTTRFFFPLPINYDYCNTCRVKFPHRLANSNKSYQEERADNYRIFLPNNYRDIPGETGEISNLFIKDNKLFIQTLQSLWVQQVKPQQIKTDQATLYVGTGEFWEIPPNEVMTTTNGYAGCQNRFGIINTPFGYFYPSTRERKVFLFNDKLSEISNQGLRNWFENNLEFELLKQYPLLPQTTNGVIDNPSNPVGVGFTTIYDKRYRRIIFTKKDYKVLNLNLELINNQWYLGDTPKDITDKTLFENKSWTISYHPDSQGWFSWHSYLPFFMFNTQNNYYSFNAEAVQTAFVHNQDNYQQFYQDTYPFINELIFNKQTLLVNTTPNIQWYSLVTNNNQELQDTFDKAIIYNDFQSSGKLTLTNQINPFQTATSPQESLIKRTERKWALNSYRDYATATPVFTSNWVNTQNNYFIDKVPVNINPNKNPFELEKFRDNYLACRLIYTKPNNKFLNKFITDTQKISPR